MRFITGQYNGQSFIGLLDDTTEKVFDLTMIDGLMGNHALPKTLIECIEEGQTFLEKVKTMREWMSSQADEKYAYHVNDIKFLAPIPRPRKNLFCVGKNYAAHAIEMGSAADIPEHPMLFSKTPTTVIGHEDIILNHEQVTDQLDYEGELAVIIGKKGKGISKEEAYDYIFGYTILNDITARDLQKRHKQFLLGKSLDTSAPMGPFIAYRSLIENPGSLNIETKVNGEVRQSANTEQFIFDIPTLISTISKGTTLEPGDIIATGTPSGVGKGFKPPRFLQPGDVIEVSIDHLGTLMNTIES